MTDVVPELVADLDYPMVVVTAAVPDGRRAGCLVGFWTQSSIDPPRAIVCLSKANHTHGVAAGATVLAVHFLGEGDRALAEHFGTETGDDVDKFAGCTWTPGPEGVPLLTGASRGWFAGRVLQRVDAGDHTAYFLRPFAGESRDPKVAQLGFGTVKDLDPGHDA